MTDEIEKLAARCAGEWNDWMRQPDWAENFSLADMLRWVNARPAGSFVNLATTLRALTARAEADEERVKDLEAGVLGWVDKAIALEKRAEAAEAREEATRAANVDTKLHWDVLKADSDAVCSRAEAAEAERDNLLRILRDGDAGAAAVFEGYVQEHQRWSERVGAAEARVEEVKAAWEQLNTLTGSHPRGPVMALAERAEAAEAEVRKLREALEWYAEQAEWCRKIGSRGDPARHALDNDGGKRARAALSPAPASGERVRHKKRGSAYRVLHRGAELQAATYVFDGMDMVVYQSETDGKVWVRAEYEFDDGRFEPAPDSGENTGGPDDKA